MKERATKFDFIFSIRRVKCDETRPSCIKCVATGRKCDGFPLLQESPSIGESQALLSHTPIACYEIPFRMPGSQRDRQLMHYFCVQGAADLSGFLPLAFWSRTVLQVSQYDDVVRQALLALSSLQMDLGGTASNSKNNNNNNNISSSSSSSNPASDSLASHHSVETAQTTTLARYGNVLRALQRRIDGLPEHDNSNQSEVVKGALICCTLFYCFESALGDSKAAMRHLESGLNLLSIVHDRRRKQQRSYCSSSSSSSNGSSSSSSEGARGEFGDFLDQVYHVLSRFDMQASFFDDARMPFLTLVSRRERAEGLGKSREDVFSTPDEARLEITRLQNWLFHLLLENITLRELPQAVIREKEKLLDEFDIWEQRVIGMLSDKALDTRALCGLQALRVQHHISRMLLASRLPDNESVFGTVPNATAEYILQLSADAIRQLRCEETGATTSRRCVFSSETGVVAPLAVLAIRCADLSVCERAMELLRESQRKEGLHDAVTLANIVRRLSILSQRRRSASATEAEGASGNVIPYATTSVEYWTADVIDQVSGGMNNLQGILDEILGHAREEV